jgi:glycine/D-amino acid oxidase-like deaminating enzyme
MSDVLIIGGGIAGIAAAARLAPYATVTLLEGEESLAYHASGRSAALYEPHYGLPPVVALSLASGDFFRGFPNLLTPRGLMILAGLDERAQFDHDCADMNLAPLDMDAARAMVPILNPETVAHVGYGAHAWDIDTDLLIADFAKTARAHGAQIIAKAGAAALRRDGGKWQAETAQGSFSGAVVINAAGPWADGVAQMAGIAAKGIVPMRRSMARIPAPAGMDVARWPMVFGAGEAWYMKPDAGALIVSPAEEHPMPPHDAFADDMVLAEGLARYEAMVTAPVTRLLASWAGLRTFAPDRVPVIGADGGDPSFFWAAGLGGYGFQTADAASRLLADLVLGRVPDFEGGLVQALSPARFA